MGVIDGEMTCFSSYAKLSFDYIIQPLNTFQHIPIFSLRCVTVSLCQGLELAHIFQFTPWKIVIFLHFTVCDTFFTCNHNIFYAQRHDKKK
jgi:hypothetical protein